MSALSYYPDINLGRNEDGRTLAVSWPPIATYCIRESVHNCCAPQTIYTSNYRGECTLYRAAFKYIQHTAVHIAHLYIFRASTVVVQVFHFLPSCLKGFIPTFLEVCPAYYHIYIYIQIFIYLLYIHIHYLLNFN